MREEDELEMEAKCDDLDAEFGRRDEEDKDYHYSAFLSLPL